MPAELEPAGDREPLGTVGPTLVILAGGLATRYGGIKPLAKVGANNESIIELTIKRAIRAGFDQIVVVVGRESGRAIEEELRNLREGTRICFVYQDGARGTADALRVAGAKAVGPRPVGVCNGDDVYPKSAMISLATRVRQGVNSVGAFQLGKTVVGEGAVNRGVLSVSSGRLFGIRESRGVRLSSNKGIFITEDGSELNENSLVAMNLFSFSDEVWQRLGESDLVRDKEELISEFVDRWVRAEPEEVFEVVFNEEACPGVTWGEDEELVREVLEKR